MTFIILASQANLTIKLKNTYKNFRKYGNTHRLFLSWNYFVDELKVYSGTVVLSKFWLYSSSEELDFAQIF